MRQVNWRIFIFYVKIRYMKKKYNKFQKKYFPNIVFGFNKEWELRNWYDSCTKNITYDPHGGKKWDLGGIPQEIEEILEKENCSIEDIKIKIEKIFNKFIKKPRALYIIKDITKRAEKRWKEAGKECLNALSKMLDIPIKEFEKNYRAYFTFGKRIPFYENRFMFSQFSDFPNTASHEIMHIEFLKKYKNYCLDKGLTEKQISHLKEILTVLLNEDLSDILYLTDRGYDSHKELRKEVLKLYKKHKKLRKNFIAFLDKLIKLLKNRWESFITMNNENKIKSKN